MREDGQGQDLPVDTNRTQRIVRRNTDFNWSGLAAIVATVALIVMGFFYLTEKSENATTIALLEASNTKKATELKRINDEREVAAKAEEAKRAAEAALPTIGGTFAVVTGTLFKLDQRADAAAKSTVAFDTCKYKGETLSFCFVEVGKKSVTEVVAVPKTAMTEIEAIALAACFNNNLPKLDSGEAVGAYAQSLSARRYAGKVCLTQ